MRDDRFLVSFVCEDLIPFRDPSAFSTSTQQSSEQAELRRARQSAWILDRITIWIAVSYKRKPYRVKYRVPFRLPPRQS